jgi:hypothetical protein
MNPQIPQGLDPTAFILTKAIKRSESSGSSNPYTATGDNGTSTGAYQIQDSNWGLWAQQYLGDANAPKTEENQNKLAYSRVKDLLSQGHTQSQVASIWNSGNPDPNAVGKGHNDKLNVDYDVPGYVNKVKQNYSTIQTELQRGFNPTPYSTPDQGQAPINPQGTPQDTGTQEKSLGQELSGRLSDAGQALSDASTGKINPLSGVLQAAGAGAGAIGDVVNKGLELIPGVKWLEGQIGQGIGALAQTPVGQSVVSSMQQFSKDHPELSADIGAGFNIATAIPILKGLGVVKDLAMTGVGQALKGIAEKGMIESIGTDMGRLKSLSRVFAKNGGEDTVKVGIGERLLPDIADGKYANSEVISNIGHKISEIDNTQLQPILEEVSKKQTVGQSLSSLKEKAIKAAEADADLREAGMVPQAVSQIEKRFTGWQYSYGDNINLATENRLKIGTGNFTNWGTPEGTADKSIYSAFQKDIEEAAQKNGFSDVHAINQKMGSLIKYRSMMQALDGKPIKVGLFGKLVRKGVSVGAGMTANSLGGGVVGGLGTAYMTDIADKGILGMGRNLRKGILERTGINAARPTVSSVVKKSAGLFGAANAQKLNR